MLERFVKNRGFAIGLLVLLTFFLLTSFTDLTYKTLVLVIRDFYNYLILISSDVLSHVVDNGLSVDYESKTIFLSDNNGFLVYGSIFNSLFFLLTSGIVFALSRNIKSGIFKTILYVVLVIVMNSFVVLLFARRGVPDVNDQYLISNVFVYVLYLIVPVLTFRKDSLGVNWLSSKISLKSRQIFIRLVLILLIPFIKLSTLTILREPITAAILSVSKEVLEAMGYEAIIFGKIIYNSQIPGIRLEYGCIGVKATMLFMYFILLIGGKWRNKLWYIPIGILVIYIMNVLRITLLFKHLVDHNGNVELVMSSHDIYNIVAYIILFLMWWVWIEKFEGIHFNGGGQKADG